MARYIDPEAQRLANLKRRLFMLRRHASLGDPTTGKSVLAQRADRLGGLKIANGHSYPSAWGLSMALWQWYRIPMKGEWR
jgi:hypothetical protein